MVRFLSMVRRFRKGNPRTPRNGPASAIRSNGERTEMSQFRKIKACALFLATLIVPTAHAVIVVDYGAIRPPSPAFANRSLPGLVMVPQAQTETGYLIQRSHAWRGYSRTDPRTGALLVYPP